MRMARAVATLLLCGCGGSGGGGTPNDFYDSASSSACQWYARCGFIGASQRSACVDDLHTLFQKYTLGDPNSYYNEAQSQKRLAWDSAAAAQCLSAYQSLTCDFTQLFNSTFIASCSHLWKGLVPEGGMCKSSLECVSGSCTGVMAACGFGTCKAYLATGADCSTMGTCNPDTDFCDSKGTKTCTARLAEGAACTNGVCKSGLACMAGTCKGPQPAGGACMTLGGAGCQAGLYCNTGGQSTGTCQPRVGNGGACTSPYGCQDGLFCTIPAMATSGTCTPILDVGAACDGSATATGCPISAQCDKVAMKCTSVQTTEGSDCSATKSCEGKDFFLLKPLYCDATTLKCTAKVPSGGACTPKPAMAPSSQEPCYQSNCDATSHTCPLYCPG